MTKRWVCAAALATMITTTTRARAEGQDFTADVQLVFRVAACGAGPAPAALWAKDPSQQPKYEQVIAAHCKALQPYMEKFRADYFTKARAWFVEHEPKDLPKTVVYPFGGGDLISALVPFPDATEITTLSLELAGDPRHLVGLTPAELDKDLHRFRTQIGPLINIATNSSVNLSDGQRDSIPAQLASHLLGLATGGYELVGARFFTIDDAGALKYVEAADLASDTKDGKSLRGNWKSPRFAQSFANVELQFKTPGDATVRTHRHIAWNLADDNLKTQGGVVKHLASKGKVTAMTKGASYLLWLKEFATMRAYLIEHMAWMLSDSTGIPPTYAKPAKLVQEPWGRFDGPILKELVDSKQDKDTRALYNVKGAKPAPFRFGYVDQAGHPHLMFTHPSQPNQ